MGGQRDTERGQAAPSPGTRLTDLLSSTGQSPGACPLDWPGPALGKALFGAEGRGMQEAGLKSGASSAQLLSPSLCYPEGGSLVPPEGGLVHTHPCIPGLSSMQFP